VLRTPGPRADVMYMTLITYGTVPMIQQTISLQQEDKAKSTAKTIATCLRTSD